MGTAARKGIAAAALVLASSWSAVGERAGVRAETAAPGPIVVDGRTDDWVGTSPMIGGRSVMSKGEFVHQDYLYDDSGKQTGQSAADLGEGRYRSYDRGDYRYPTDDTRYRANSADLFQFRAAQRGDRVYFLLRFNTLLVPDATVAAIAIGPYGETGPARPWPYGAQFSTPGTRHVVTVWGTGGAFDDVDLAAVGGELAVDTDANAFELSLPVALVGSRFRAYVGTGIWDVAKHEWMALTPFATAMLPGGGTALDARVFNLAFRDQEDGFYFEIGQARSLLLGDVSAFHADVDLMAPDDPPPTIGPGFHQVIFESSVTVPPGEGVERAGVPGRGYNNFPEATFTEYSHLGRHQPYGAYVPEAYDGAVLALHGGGGTHGFITPGAIKGFKEFGDAARSVIVAPLARGEYSWYTDYAHLDALEAFEDALDRFAVDRTRLAVWGYSMGGMGVSRFQVLHPDLFNTAILWAAASGGDENYWEMGGNPPNGNPVDLVENVAGIQGVVQHCPADATVPYTTPLRLTERLDALGQWYRFRSYAPCEHLAPTEVPNWSDDARAVAQARKDLHPARVTFKTSEAWWRPDVSPRLVFDRAYWVSGVRVRDTTDGMVAFGTVDATTKGLGKAPFATAPLTPSAGTLPPFAYVETGRAPTVATPIPKENAFSAELTNVRTVTFDLAAMGLRVGKRKAEPLRLALDADGPGEVRLLGVGRKPVVTGTGSGPLPTAAVQDGDDLVLTVPASGTWDLQVFTR